MNLTDESILVAKITWADPQSGETLELVLPEGGSASIGRLESNDICIQEQHVSRQHATIQYRDGVFVITDLGSANGVFVNDKRLTEPYPLMAGDEIRLFVPILRFSALVGEADSLQATEGTAPPNAAEDITGPRLIIGNGPQEGKTMALPGSSVRIGRASSNADWEICLQDPSVSRPHARMELIDNNWVLYDLGSANGTVVNSTPVNEKGRVLHDGDMIAFGGTITQFRST